MPQLKEVTAANNTLRPSETGVEALAGAGRRAGAFYNQAAESIRQSAQDQARAAFAEASAKGERAKSFGDVGKSLGELGSQAEQAYAHQEISHLSATVAQGTSNATNAWNGIVSDPKTDPNNASIAGQFREEQLEPMFDKWRQAATTEQAQRFVEARIEATRNHFFEKQSADMSALAGEAVKTNWVQKVNAWTNTARSDPSSVPFLLDETYSHAAAIVGTSPNLKGIDGAKLHSEMTLRAQEAIAKAGALGAIERSGDPEHAWQTWAQRYPGLINAQQMDQFAKTAKMQSRANLLQEKQLATFQRAQDEQGVKAASNKSFSDNVSFDPATGQAVVNPNLIKDHLEIVKKFPDAPNAADHARAVINWTEAQQKDHKPVDDPATLRDLTDRLYSPDNPTTRLDLMKANATGKLSNGRFQSMERLVTELEQGPIKEPIFKAAMDGAKATITKGPLGVNLNLDPATYDNFRQDFIPRYIAAKRAGTLEPDALDLKNPNSMISKSLAPYVQSQRDQLQGIIGGNGGLNFTGQPNPVAPARPAVPAAGEVRGGFRFKGGDPSKPENWVKVQ